MEGDGVLCIMNANIHAYLSVLPHCEDKLLKKKKTFNLLLKTILNIIKKISTIVRWTSKYICHSTQQLAIHGQSSFIYYPRLPHIISKQNLCIISSSNSFLNPATRINPQIWQAVGSRTVYAALFYLDFLSFPPPFFFPFKVMFYETLSCDLKLKTKNKKQQLC